MRIKNRKFTFWIEAEKLAVLQALAPDNKPTTGVNKAIAFYLESLKNNQKAA